MKQVVFMPLIVATLRDSDKAKRGDQVSAAPYDIAGFAVFDDEVELGCSRQENRIFGPDGKVIEFTGDAPTDG